MQHRNRPSTPFPSGLSFPVACLRAVIFTIQHPAGLPVALTIDGSPVTMHMQDVLQELWNVLDAKGALRALRLECILQVQVKYIGSVAVHMHHQKYDRCRTQNVQPASRPL